MKSWFLKMINKIDKPLTRLIKKKESGPKSIESEMKKEKLHPTPQKYKGSEEISMKKKKKREISMNDYMPIKWKI